MALQLSTTNAELKPHAAVARRPLVEVKDLKVKFVSREAPVQAVKAAMDMETPGEAAKAAGREEHENRENPRDCSAHAWNLTAPLSS